MKEVALELDAMGYSYMKMQVWVVDTSKAKQSKTKQKRHPPPQIHIYNPKTQSSSWFPLHSDQLDLWQSFSLTVITCLHVSLPITLSTFGKKNFC